MSVYGHKTLFEQRVSPQRRVAFQIMALEVAKNNEDEFYEAWIKYRALNPAKRQEDQKAADSETERMMRAVLGSEDEEDPVLLGLPGLQFLLRLRLQLRLRLRLRKLIESRALAAH